MAVHGALLVKPSSAGRVAKVPLLTQPASTGFTRIAPDRTTRVPATHVVQGGITWCHTSKALELRVAAHGLMRWLPIDPCAHP